MSFSSALRLRRFTRRLFAVLMLPVILFEEWGWKPLAALMRRLAQLSGIAKLEAIIARAPRHWALACFLAPSLLLLPFKLGAFWLIAHGQKVFAIAILVLAKIVSTAIVGRLFILTSPQLMSYGWFAKAYNWWRQTKDAALTWMHAQPFYVQSKLLVASIKAKFSGRRRRSPKPQVMPSTLAKPGATNPGDKGPS